MTYRIRDEPRPGALAHLAVNPVWPLLGVMFGGAGLSWTWFVFNGIAIGSPTRRQELGWAIGGFVGSFLLILGIGQLGADERLGALGVRYAMVGLTVWKLAISYWLCMLQNRSFHLYEHFGGQVRNGALVVVVGYFLINRILPQLPPLWIMVLR